MRYTWAMALRSVCVFCGSRTPLDPCHASGARVIGERLAQNGIELVYGAGRIGLMGELADACLAAGGRVVGIIPEHLRSLEVAHQGLDELQIVDDMMSRKRMMIERSDAFLIMAGGFGTLDEWFEVLTFKQLGLHHKPIVVLDLEGYWSSMLAALQELVHGGAIRPPELDLFRVVVSIDDIVPAITQATADDR